MGKAPHPTGRVAWAPHPLCLPACPLAADGIEEEVPGSVRGDVETLVLGDGKWLRLGQAHLHCSALVAGRLRAWCHC